GPYPTPFRAPGSPGRRQSAQRPPLLGRKHTLGDLVEIGQRPDALDVDADASIAGHRVQPEALRVRDVETQTEPIEGRRELGLAVWAVTQSDQTRLDPEAVGEADAQRRPAHDEAARVAPEVKSRGAIPLVDTEVSDEAVNRLRIEIEARAPQPHLGREEGTATPVRRPGSGHNWLHAGVTPPAGAGRDSPWSRGRKRSLAPPCRGPR